MPYDIQNGPPPAMKPVEPLPRGVKSRYKLRELHVGQFIWVPIKERGLVTRAVRHAAYYHNMQFRIGHDETGKLVILRIS